MLSIQQVAQEFDINADQLIDQSLRLYLHQQLVRVETELFHYAKKYGVNNIEELDQKLQNGFLQEDDLIDGFFIFDHLEHEKNAY